MGIRRPAPAAASYLDEDEEIIPQVVRKARDEDEDDAPRGLGIQRRRLADQEEEVELSPALQRSAQRRREIVRDEDDEPRAAIPRQRETNGEDDALEEENEDFHASTNSRVAAGWGAAKKLQSEGSDYTSEFKLSEQDTLIKFIGDAPFAVYRQHFLREKEGKKSYICLGRGCPLCDDLGHVPDKKFAFTVVDLTQPTLAASMLAVGPKLLGTLEKANSGKYGPLDKHYWEISRSGTGRQTTYNLNIVKDRYLEDEYSLNPAKIESVIGKIQPFTPDVIKESSKAELREIVAELDA